MSTEEPDSLWPGLVPRAAFLLQIAETRKCPQPHWNPLIGQWAKEDTGRNGNLSHPHYSKQHPRNKDIRWNITRYFTSTLYYYTFKKYVEYIFSPGCLSMMSFSILRLWLAARTIASFVFVGDCLKQFKTIITNNHKLEWLRHSFSTFLFWSSLLKYQL